MCHSWAPFDRPQQTGTSSNSATPSSSVILLAVSDVPPDLGQVTVRQSSLFGALWWEIRKRVRSDLLL